MQDSKPIKSTRITPGQWTRLKARLVQDNKKSTMVIRWCQKERLGFLDREHQVYNPYNNHYEHWVYLDWYDEHKKTMFVLRYSEYLERK